MTTSVAVAAAPLTHVFVTLELIRNGIVGTTAQVVVTNDGGHPGSRMFTSGSPDVVRVRVDASAVPDGGALF